MKAKWKEQQSLQGEKNQNKTKENRTMFPVCSFPHSRSPAPWKGSCLKLGIQFGGCAVSSSVLKQRKIQFALDKCGQSCESEVSFLRQQRRKKRYEWGRQVGSLCMGGLSGSTPLRGPLQVIHLSYVLLLDGCTGRYYFGFISIFASLPAFLSLVPIYHTKIHAIFWDLYVGCPDMYS